MFLVCFKNRYSAINEINKMLGNEGRVFVYFITKLSRMESGTSYVGFHGGRSEPRVRVAVPVAFVLFLIWS